MSHSVILALKVQILDGFVLFCLGHIPKALEDSQMAMLRVLADLEQIVLITFDAELLLEDSLSRCHGLIALDSDDLAFFLDVFDLRLVPEGRVALTVYVNVVLLEEVAVLDYHIKFVFEVVVDFALLDERFIFG